MVSKAPLLLAGLTLAGVGPVMAQVRADLVTGREPVLLRFSNPWSISTVELARVARADSAGRPGVALRPAGRIVNHGSQPVLVIAFVQAPVGFERGEILLRSGRSGYRIEVGDTATVLGGPGRPIWTRGVVPPGSTTDLGDWSVADPNAVAALLASGRVQIGLVAAALTGAVDAELVGFSPLGPDAPDPATRGLLFPRAVYLTGRHELDRSCFIPSSNTPAEEDP